MATSAFKSTTKRSSERSRSLSRGRFGFVNTVRGSALPDTNLHDEIAAQRRGRSVSRPHTALPTTSQASATRRRSVSVARYQFSDSESEDCSHGSRHGTEKSFGSSNNRKKPMTLNHQRLLKRSFSQKELSKSCDGYSSHSSALTDEEALDKNGTERTVRHSQKKTEHPTGGVPTGLYEVMCKELRHAVEDIRTEIEQGIMKAHHPVLADDNSLQSNNSDVLQAVSVMRKSYTTKLEQSEKRKQDLLAEIEAEEQRSRELSKIVKELLPEANRKNDDDKNWMSKSLVEDAEKYFDDFLSNIEDTTTDISSFDGERSDASSKKYQQHNNNNTSEMDGVVLPWLQWETSTYDAKTQVPFVAQIKEVHAYKCASFNMADYSEDEEDIIFESWRQRLRITSGTLSICTRPFLHF